MPIYPPARASQLEEHLRRHAGILDNARATLLVTVPEAMVVARLLQARVAGVAPCRDAAATAPRAGGVPAPVAVRGDDIALPAVHLRQHRQPQGRGADARQPAGQHPRDGRRRCRPRPRDVFVSWLPLYHDMGLIGAWLGGLYVGFPLVVMSPLAFLARPERWLRAIHRHRGTLSAAPNFAYELCVKRDRRRRAGRAST